MGERYLPYNPNIKTLTFSSRIPSQMAASQIASLLLLFIAASQSLKGTNTTGPQNKGPRTQTLLLLLYRLLFWIYAICWGFPHQLLIFNVKWNCCHYLLEAFLLNLHKHTHTHTQACLRKSVTTHPFHTTNYCPTAAYIKVFQPRADRMEAGCVLPLITPF